MTREAYLNELARELNKLSEGDRADALEYYREYFDEAGAENEQKVIEELGTPRKLAAQIKAELAFRQAQENPKSAKKGLHAVLVGIGAVFAAPIAIPLALALAVVVLALVIVLVAVLFSFFAVGIGLGAGGLMALLMTVLTVFQSPATGLSCFGVALALLGFGGLVFIPTLLLSRWSFRKLAAFLNRKMHKKAPPQTQAV